MATSDSRRREFKLKNRLFIVLIVVTNTIGNLFLAVGMKQMPEFGAVPGFAYIGSFLSNYWIWAGIALLVVWMIAQLSMFSWADMTYVVPVTGAAYILTAIAGWLFLNEHISLGRWLGIVLVSFGVILVAETPPRTLPRPEVEDP